MVPQFLGTQDHPWLRVLLEERDRFIGRPQRELDARLREPLPCASPPVKLKLAVRVFARLQRTRRTCAAVPPRKAREVLFQAAAREAALPSVVLARVAAELGVAPRWMSPCSPTCPERSCSGHRLCPSRLKTLPFGSTSRWCKGCSATR